MAGVPDSAFAGDEMLTARRIVYRVTLKVTPGMGSTVSALRAETTELYIDVSRDRLRATFVGRGWPVPPGSQVRIRHDQPGVYLFDGAGGRPLGPGQMARWFRGGRVPNSPRLWIRQPQGRLDGPGPLVCRLVAEWAKASVDDLARRCMEGGTPPAFRIGPWLAEGTADVEVQLPRHALRADERSPPRPAPHMTHGAIVPTSVMVHLRPRWRGPRIPDAGPNATHSLEIQNAGRRRMIVIMNGTAVGWLDSGTTAVFEGLRAGSYRLGAMDPFGPQNAPLRASLVPGRVRLPR